MEIEQFDLFHSNVIFQLNLIFLPWENITASNKDMIVHTFPTGLGLLLWGIMARFYEIKKKNYSKFLTKHFQARAQEYFYSLSLMFKNRFLYSILCSHFIFEEYFRFFTCLSSEIHYMYVILYCEKGRKCCFEV